MGVDNWFTQKSVIFEWGNMYRNSESKTTSKYVLQKRNGIFKSWHLNLVATTVSAPLHKESVVHVGKCSVRRTITKIVFRKRNNISPSVI